MESDVENDGSRTAVFTVVVVVVEEDDDNEGERESGGKERVKHGDEDWTSDEMDEEDNG